MLSPGSPILQDFAAIGQPEDYRAVFARRKNHIAAGLTYQSKITGIEQGLHKVLRVFRSRKVAVAHPCDDVSLRGAVEDLIAELQTRRPEAYLGWPGIQHGVAGDERSEDPERRVPGPSLRYVPGTL